MAIVQPYAGEIKSFDGRIESAGVWVLPRKCQQPGCTGRLQRHSSYRRMYSEHGENQSGYVWIECMRCTKCGATHAVLPSFLAPYQRMVTAVREEMITLWCKGKSAKELVALVGLSIRTIRRWIKRAIRRGKVFARELDRLCHEYEPALPVEEEALDDAGTSLAEGDRGVVARALCLSRLWQELTLGLGAMAGIGGWAAVNVVGPLCGMWW